MLNGLRIRCVCWLMRAWPRLPGRWRVVEWLWRRERVIASFRPATIRVGAGYRMHVNPADYTERTIWINGFDPRDQQSILFKRALRRGDCVIDVGANVGYYSLLAASLVGPTGSVHAFEPCSAILPRLRRNAALNPDAAIEIHPQALSDRARELRFFVASNGHSGLSSLRDLQEKTETVITVPALPLDDLIDELPAVRLIKIDVEGAELLALRGAQRLIERDQPDLLLELTDSFLRELGGNAQELCTLLRGLGYPLYRIGANARLEPIETAPREQCNVLAPGRASRIDVAEFGKMP